MEDTAMVISAETFQRIIESIRSYPKGEDKRDKRQQPRVGFTGFAEIVLCAPGSSRKPILVRVRDLSNSGIGVLHHKAIAVGEQFVLNLNTASPSDTALLCTVMRCQRIEENLFGIGASFTREL